MFARNQDKPGQPDEFGRHDSDRPAEDDRDNPQPRDMDHDPMIDLGDVSVYEQTIAKLQNEKAELNERLLRTLADYQNSQRRAANNEREAKLQGTSSVVMNILTVLDHFDLALQQDPSKSTAQQIIDGVRVIRDELVRVLSNNGVMPLAPQANDEFDPMRHEALMKQRSESVPPGRIVATLQPGYTLATPNGDRVIRSAKVSVSEG